jgi:hypothetical protein
MARVKTTARLHDDVESEVVETSVHEEMAECLQI